MSSHKKGRKQARKMWRNVVFTTSGFVVKGGRNPQALSFLHGKVWQNPAVKANPLQREAGVSCWKQNSHKAYWGW